MKRRASIVLGLATERDLSALRQWRSLPDWPQMAGSAFSDRQNFRSVLNNHKEIIMIAKTLAEAPIGLAHFSASGLSPGTAQYSAAIPLATERSIGRGRDLLLLTMGAAFFVFRYHEIFSLIDAGKNWLISKCLASGFCEEPDFRFLGLNALREPGMKILRTTAATWARRWSQEFADKARQDPWLKQNVAWADLASPSRLLTSPRTITALGSPAPSDLAAEHRDTDQRFRPPRKVLF